MAVAIPYSALIHNQHRHQASAPESKNGNACMATAAADAEVNETNETAIWISGFAVNRRSSHCGSDELRGV
eukprot:4598882-Pleurochrysis_carterae.AAC.1